MKGEFFENFFKKQLEKHDSLSKKNNSPYFSFFRFY